MDREEAAATLLEAKETIEEALAQARMAINDAAPELWASAKAYWWAHIRCALDKEHEFLGGSMQTLQDTVEALTGSKKED